MAQAPDDDPEVAYRHDDLQAEPAAPPRLRRRGIYLLPNLFTTGVLFCGFFAIVQAMNGRYDTACIAIFIAMVLDGMDGRVARWTGADVVVQNFRPGVVDRLGFGYDAIKARNPRVIYASISGYGPTGPYANRPVVDPIIQALTAMVARQQSEAIPLPDLIRHIVVDKATALTVAQAVSAALFHRERSGEGDHLVIPMLDVGAYFFWPDGMMDYTLLGEGIAGGPRIADTYALTQCSDGQLIYYAPTNDMRLALYRVLGHPELCDDPRFKDVHGLMADDNFATLGTILVAAFEQRTVDQVVDDLVEAGIPVARILEPDEVFDDEQFIHNGTFVTWEHPQAGTLRQPRHPVRFASAETPVPEWVPGLGEHTDTILAELGRTSDQVAALRDAGVVF